jgi:DivIVA domain-containing protein
LAREHACEAVRCWLPKKLFRSSSPALTRLGDQDWDWSYSGAVADDELSKADKRETRSPARPEPEHSFGELRHYVPQDILGVSFPVSVRGYDRRAVDAYTERVNRVIAELKLRASPPAAVRHALEQAEDKVQGLLRAAREAAEEITASAQREAEESTARAKAEAAELIVNTSSEAERVKAEADELIANARTEADETLAKAKAGGRRDGREGEGRGGKPRARTSRGGRASSTLNGRARVTAGGGGDATARDSR